MATDASTRPAETGRSVSTYRTLKERAAALARRAGRATVYSSLYIALVAVTEVVIATVLLSLPLTLAPAVVGLVTFAVYATDRLADADTDAVSNPRQAAFVRRHGDVLYLLASASYALAVTLSLLGGPVAFGITLLPGVFWVLYASDWVPNVGLHIRRLKQVFVVNSAVVALAWAVTLTFLPLAFADAPLSPAVGVVFLYFLLRSFVDTEIPNVRDVDADRLTDVATVPVVLGVRRTRHVLYGVDLGTLALVALAAAAGLLSVGLAAALGVGLVYSLGLVAAVGRVDDEELLSKLPECEYLLVALALAAVVGVV
jgi:4-hydroxybenzoate polyprenyltransferase